jgi:uncharacterized membrane protein (Fun14 family)
MAALFGRCLLRAGNIMLRPTAIASGLTVSSMMLAPASPSLCAAAAASPPQPPNGNPSASSPLGPLADFLPASLPGPLSGMVDLSPLQLQVLGVSGLTGYTAGFALKRAFRVFVFTSGCIFMGLQTLAQNGLVTVHWEEIERQLILLADVNGDGKVDQKDMQQASDKLQAYLSAGLPSAGSFGVGMLAGLRS